MDNSTNQRVADAPSDNWVYRILPVALWPYAQLARWDRPIGWWLLLWPCWWSLALAYNVKLEAYFAAIIPLMGPGILVVELIIMLALFMIGAIAMRGAGCTYNDMVDKDIDAKVERTASRPIPSGRVTTRQAKVFLLLQALVGALVIFSFNWFSIILGIASLIIVAIYPFAKRITNWPQFVLGLAFSWGAMMGWATVFGELGWPPILLYAGSILWVIGYDTLYAHQDKEDDALVGVRSTARLFAEKTKLALVFLYGAALILFLASLHLAEISWPAYLALAIGGAHMGWQIKVLDIDDGVQCLKLFQSNKHFGWIVFAGLLASMLI
jgi:4-hydroxybenzoate polyprenyltransferase